MSFSYTFIHIYLSNSVLGACEENENNSGSEVFYDLVNNPSTMWYNRPITDVNNVEDVFLISSVSGSNPNRDVVRAHWNLTTNAMYFVDQGRVISLYTNVVTQ